MTYLVLSNEELANIEQALIFASRYLKGDSISPEVMKIVNYKPKLDTYQLLINKIDKERKA